MTVRSYRHRRGRMGTTTAAALERLSDQIVMVDGTPLDIDRLFGRGAPLVVEVGSGMGEATAEMGAADPARNILAIDVHVQGLGRLLRRIEDLGLANIRVAEGDAVILLRDMLPAGAIDEVRVFFPDPWPKARHAKRRLVQSAFLDLVATRLRAGGVLHVATDWGPYAEQMQALLDAHPTYDVIHQGPRPAHRPVTRFEQQGLDAGRTSYDVIARRV
jgi:tRNA (guanine-N7-)-methyltransferase